jgi:hypothetical protein
MSQHPLSRRRLSNSPDVLTEEDATALPLAAQTASHEHRQSFRGRSKSLAYGSLAWTMNAPRFPVGYENTNMVGGNQASAAKSWEPILEKAIRAIISIKASHVRSFDTETSGMASRKHNRQPQIIQLLNYYSIQVFTPQLDSLSMPNKASSCQTDMLCHQRRSLRKPC